MRLRSVLVIAIGIAAMAADTDALVEALRTDPSPKVRSQAALKLATLPADENVLELIVALRNDKSPLVRGACARALGMLGSPKAYRDLDRAAHDQDAFVAKWSNWALLRVIASAPVMAITIKGLVATGRFKSEDATLAFQESVLMTLIETGRFDVAATIDFDENQETSNDVVTIELRGEVTQVTGDALMATASVAVSALTPTGNVVWRGRASGSATGEPPPQPDPDEDEWTIRPEGKDARVLAIGEAGKAAARALAEALSRKPK